jgi:hypothetical protein
VILTLATSTPSARMTRPPLTTEASPSPSSRTPGTVTSAASNVPGPRWMVDPGGTDASAWASVRHGSPGSPDAVSSPSSRTSNSGALPGEAREGGAVTMGLDAVGPTAVVGGLASASPKPIEKATAAAATSRSTATTPGTP